MNCTLMNVAAAQGMANSSNTHPLIFDAPRFNLLVSSRTTSRANKQGVRLDLERDQEKQGKDGTEHRDKTGIVIERYSERRCLAEAIAAARKRAEEDQQQTAVAEGPDETGFSV